METRRWTGLPLPYHPLTRKTCGPWMKGAEDRHGVHPRCPEPKAGSKGPWITFSVCLSPCLCISLSLCLCLSISLCLSMSLSVSVSLCQSLFLSVSLCPVSVSLCLCLFLSLSLFLCLCLFLSASLFLCIFLSLSPFNQDPHVGLTPTQNAPSI